MDREITTPELEATIKQRAARLGKSVDELLADDRQSLRSSKYPSADCFNPFEVEQFCLGDLPPERITHAQSCSMCAAMLEVAKSWELPLNTFMHEVAAARPALNASQKKTSAVRDPLTDIVLVTAPILVLCAGAAAAIGLKHDVILSISISALGWSSLGSLSAALAIALIALLGGIAVARWLGTQRSFQKFGGAAIGGLFAVFTVGYGIFFTWHVTSNYLRLQFAEDRVLSIIAERLNSGTGYNSAVRYSPDSNNLVGTVVAEPRQNSVDIYWDHGKRMNLGTAYLGHITYQANGKATVRTVSKVIDVNAASSQLSQMPKQGEAVFALVPANAEKASRIFPLDQLLQTRSQR